MNVYPPREDSYFLKDFLEQLDLENKRALDMGTGSGILAVVMAEQGAEVTAADINEEALEAAKKRAEDAEVEIETIETDLFQQIEDKYDIIVFNPPYLPGREMEGDEKWRGGDKGIGVTKRFLNSYSGYLREDGEVLFLASSRAEHEDILDRFEVLESENLWFETLYLLRGK